MTATTAVKPRRCTRHASRHQAGCEACRTFSRQYRRIRDDQLAAGTWTSQLVPAGEASRHIRHLLASGMRIVDIVADTRISHAGLTRILYGADRVTTRAANVATILAVRPRPVDSALVDGTGTRRRLRALARIGYPQPDLAARLGCAETLISRWLHQGRAHRDTAAAVKVLYDRLHATEGPSRIAAERAGRCGWDGPEAWSDQTIDDPQAEPFSWLRDDVDEVAVEQVEQGKRSWGSLTDAEQRTLVRRHTERAKPSTMATWWGASRSRIERLVAEVAATEVAA
jgi:hypothetical protein